MDKDEIEIEKNIQTNKQYLEQFEKHLQSQNLSNKTIKNHIMNVEFYINDYLNYYEPQNIQAGITSISGYLSDWFIRKAMWSSVASIKANAASIKKFYKYMSETGIVSTLDYDFLCSIIKSDLPEWLENLKEYDAGFDDEYF
ncbi:MAG: hypothetical protein RR537_05550 [Longicatena sp.]